MRHPMFRAAAIGLVLIATLSTPALAQRATSKPGKTTTTSTSDTTPPTIKVPGDLQAEATAAAGAMVQYTVTASDNVDRKASASCAPASGSTFALGKTTVNCESRDSAGNLALASFAVSVTDTGIPTIGLPGPLSAEAPDANGTPVSFSVTASDLVDSSPAVSCTPAAGSVFPLGDTRVQCLAEDASGNVSDGSFVVSVTSATPPPATDPVATDPVSAPAPVPLGSAALSWSVPTTRANGAPLSASELAGYEIYVLSESTGETSVITVSDPLSTQYTVDGLPIDVYHFAVGAVDTAGQISELSSIVSKDLR